MRFAPLARLLAPIALLCASATAQAPTRELFSQIDSIAHELEAISGLKLKRAVPSAFITRDHVNQFLKKRIKEVASPEELRAEEVALKKLGLAPPEFDLAKNTVELLTEQAAAFYDYNRRKLFITEGGSSETQTPVLAHELAHALADQHFNLGRYIKQGKKSDDGSSARLAVMEGQASWLMSEYVARKTGQSLLNSPALVNMMSRMNDVGSGQYPVFDKAPLYLRITLIFPYTKGMLFQHAAVLKLGKEGFAEVFRRAPVSTQQVLHPEKYFDRVEPTRPALPTPPKLRGYKELIGGSLGELDHSVLLEQFGGRALAEELAPHWRGSQFVVLERRSDRRSVLLYSSEWDSEAVAERYLRFYQESLAKKWKTMKISSESAGSVSGAGDDGRFELRRAGAIVTGMEGLPPGLN